MSTISTKILDLKGLDYITEVATPDLVVEGYGEDIKKEDVGDYVTQVGIASTLTSQFKTSEPEINEPEEPTEETPKDEVVEESPEVTEEVTNVVNNEVTNEVTKDEPSTTEEEIVVDETTPTSDDTIE